MRRALGFMVGVGAVIVGAAAYGGRVLATPAAGFDSTTLALGRFDEFAVRHRSPDGVKQSWQSGQATKGASDLYVQNNLLAPGATSGWHTHPGHSLITVTAGSVTVYEGDDPSCAPRVYTAGMGFVDHGGDHVHLLRNETSKEARTVAVQLIPAAATRRIDAERPTQCSAELR